MKRCLDYKLIISINLFNDRKDINDNALHYVIYALRYILVLKHIEDRSCSHFTVCEATMVLYHTNKDHSVFSSTGHLNDWLWNGQHPLRLSVIGQLLRVETQSSVATVTKCVQISIG